MTNNHSSFDAPYTAINRARKWAGKILTKPITFSPVKIANGMVHEVVRHENKKLRGLVTLLTVSGATIFPLVPYLNKEAPQLDNIAYRQDISNNSVRYTQSPKPETKGSPVHAHDYRFISSGLAQISFVYEDERSSE